MAAQPCSEKQFCRKRMFKTISKCLMNMESDKQSVTSSIKLHRILISASLIAFPLYNYLQGTFTCAIILILHYKMSFYALNAFVHLMLRNSFILEKRSNWARGDSPKKPIVLIIENSSVSITTQQKVLPMSLNSFEKWVLMSFWNTLKLDMNCVFMVIFMFVNFKIAGTVIYISLSIFCTLTAIIMYRICLLHREIRYKYFEVVNQKDEHPPRDINKVNVDAIEEIPSAKYHKILPAKDQQSAPKQPNTLKEIRSMKFKHGVCKDNNYGGESTSCEESSECQKNSKYDEKMLKLLERDQSDSINAIKIEEEKSYIEDQPNISNIIKTGKDMSLSRDQKDSTSATRTVARDQCNVMTLENMPLVRYQQDAISAVKMTLEMPTAGGQTVSTTAVKTMREMLMARDQLYASNTMKTVENMPRDVINMTLEIPVASCQRYVTSAVLDMKTMVVDFVPIRHQIRSTNAEKADKEMPYARYQPDSITAMEVPAARHQFDAVNDVLTVENQHSIITNAAKVAIEMPTAEYQNYASSKDEDIYEDSGRVVARKRSTGCHKRKKGGRKNATIRGSTKWHKGCDDGPKNATCKRLTECYKLKRNLCRGATCNNPTGCHKRKK